MAGHWVRFFNAGELQTLTAWLDGLPAELVEADPRLCVARAWIALDLGRPQSAAPWVERAEAGPAGDPVLRLETAALRAVHRFKLGDVAAARAAAERAVRDADGAAGLWRTAALCVLGGAAAWQGHPGPARDALAAAVDVAEAMDNDLGGAYASGYLAFLAARDGDVAEAERHAEAALTRRAGAGFSGHFALAMAHTARGWALVDAGRHEEAAAAAGRGVELARGGASPVELSVSLLALARATAAGDRGQAEAERLLAEAWALVRACPDPGEVAQLLAAFERTALARREPPAAGDALTRQELAVLLLLAGDRTQREIGGELFVSVNTVKTHVKALYRKLDASTRAEAVARARAAGLVP